MYGVSSKQPNARKETISTTKTRGSDVRVTRSRAKALGVSMSPSNPAFKQELKRVPRACKRRAVLKDVTNTLAESVMHIEGNVKACKRSRKETKQKAEEGLVDVNVEKSKLAEDLSKIKMVESLDSSASNSKDEQKEEDRSDVTDCLEVADIDSNVQDPQFCSLYASSIYDSIHVAELEERPSASYMVQVQREINPYMRGILIDWLVEVSEAYKLASDTLYLAVNLIDRFLSHNSIEKQRLQLLGVTCMLIASKYEEISAPPLEEFCLTTDNTCTRQEVLSMEIQVLNLLHFRLSVPTIKKFLRRFIRVAQVSDKVPSIEMEFLANYFAELTLLEYTFLRFLPSLIAASAVFLARWTLDQSNHPWNPTLQYYTRYEASALKNTVLALEDLQLNTSGSTLTVIRTKYNQEKFNRVAALRSPERVTTLFSK